LTHSLRVFCKETATQLHTHPSQLRGWELAAIDALTTRIIEHKDEAKTIPAPSQPEIDAFHQSNYVSYVDKSPQHYSFMSKQYAYEVTTEELQTSNAYAALTDTTDEIILALRTYLRSVGFTEKEIPHKLAYLYPVVKFHKSPLSFRFMAGSVQITMTPLSAALNTILKALMPDFHTLWTNTFTAARLTPYPWWICSGAHAIRTMIDELNRTRRDASKHDTHFSSWDLSTLYTTLDQNDLITRITRLFERVFALHEDPPILDVYQDTVTWTTDKPRTPLKRYHYLALDDLTEWLTYLVQNTYIVHTDQVYQQIVGIPMGTNCAVFLADLHLFSFELDFITTLIETNQLTLLHSYKCTRRYIDDVLAANNPHYEKHRYLSPLRTGIYPADTLVLNAEQTDLPLHFLDIQVLYDIERHNYYTTVWDKRYDPKYHKLPSQKYPLITTALTRNSLFAILTGRMHTARILSSRRTDCIDYTVRTMHTMITNGYNPNALLAHTHSFTATKSSTTQKQNHSN